MFSRIPAKGGFCRNPNPEQFIGSYKINSMRAIKHVYRGANVEPDAENEPEGYFDSLKKECQKLVKVTESSESTV